MGSALVKAWGRMKDVAAHTAELARPCCHQGGSLSRRTSSHLGMSRNLVAAGSGALEQPRALQGRRHRRSLSATDRAQPLKFSFLAAARKLWRDRLGGRMGTQEQRHSGGAGDGRGRREGATAAQLQLQRSFWGLRVGAPTVAPMPRCGARACIRVPRHPSRLSSSEPS